ncbi:MAG: hypothetical protein WCR86_11920 [Parabacteroides sp.]
MIKIYDFRLVVEKHDTHEKYYPKVISFNTVADYPLSSPPAATIEVFSPSHLNDVANVSQIEFDDVVRLQVSERYHCLESYVWEDIFEGRVENQSKELSDNYTITLSCKGHIQQAFYKGIPVALAWSNKDASVILHDLAIYVDRFDYNTDYIDTGLTVTDYSMQIDKNMVVDAYKEMETLSGYKRMIDVVPVYNTSGNLQICHLKWKSLPTVANSRYAVYEYTPRLISASFDVFGEDVANYRHVLGGTDSGGNQYAGSIGDTESISLYGRRDQIDTFTWIQSNSLCTKIADGLLQGSKLPYVAGSVVLEGTSSAKVGDRVTVKIPSLEVRGIEIDGNYTVYRVARTLSSNGYQTTLDLGRIKKTAYDYIAQNLTSVVMTCYKNQVK